MTYENTGVLRKDSLEIKYTKLNWKSKIQRK